MSVFDFIVVFKGSHDGNSPTTREIADGCGITSTSVVNYYLRSLADAGLIEFGASGASRRIQVVGGVWLSPAALAHTRHEIAEDLSAQRIR